MEIEVIEKKENLLLDRTEVKFKVIHAKEQTPKRDDVRAKLAELLGVGKDTLVVSYMKPKYGICEILGYAKVYKSKDAINNERLPVLVRNKLKEKKKKEAGPAAQQQK